MRLPVRPKIGPDNYITVAVVDFDNKLVCMVYPEDMKLPPVAEVIASAQARAKLIARAINDYGGDE